MTDTASAPDTEQAVHDLGTGMLVVNRSGADVQAHYTGTGVFVIGHDVMEALRTIFDHADQAAQAVKDGATAVADEGIAAAEFGANPVGAVSEAAAGVDAGERAVRDVEAIVAEVMAQLHPAVVQAVTAAAAGSNASATPAAPPAPAAAPGPLAGFGQPAQPANA